MKRFQFSLDRVLSFRTTQAERERAKLEAILSHRAALERAQQQVIEESLDLRRHIPIDAAERQARADYWLFLQRRQKQLTVEMAHVDAQAHTQRAAVLEAERNCELLDKLKGQRLGEWQQAVDRELEELADDSFRARSFAARSRAEER
jgi:hypothetical protein